MEKELSSSHQEGETIFGIIPVTRVKSQIKMVDPMSGRWNRKVVVEEGEGSEGREVRKGEGSQGKKRERVKVRL